jgi:hypothetical protein
MITLPKFLRYLLLCIALLTALMYMSACSKKTDAKPAPVTYEVRIEGINADSTGAGYSPIASFQTN